MFARPDPEEIKCLLDETIADFGVSAEPMRERPIAWTQPACLFAEQ